MAKAKATDLIAQGFQPEQFGMKQGDEWIGDEGFLATLVGEAGRWAAARIGSAYATVPTPSFTEDCIRKAEIQYAAAELFRRRIAYFDSAAHVALQNPAHAERKGYENDAARAWEAACGWLSEAQRELGIDVTGSPVASMGVIETGRFAPLVHA